MRKNKKQNNTPGKARIIVIALIALLILLSTAQIFLAARVATTGEEIHRLEQEKDALVLRTQRLEARINQVSTLSYIENKAREDLGMVSAVGKITYLDMPAVDYFASVRNR